MRYFKKIIVTGAAGFVGSMLVPLLLDEGYNVIAIDDLSKGRRGNLPEDCEKFTFIQGDLRNRIIALDKIKGSDWVIHLASQAYGVAYCSQSHSSTFLLNSQINANVLEAVLENSIPGLLVMSSSCVYSDEVAGNIEESFGFYGEPESVNWGYGWAKRMLEIAVLAAIKDKKCEGIIVRPVNIYGDNYDWFGQYSHVIPSIVKRIFDGDDPLIIWGDGTQSRSFIHVKDVVRVILELSKRAPNGTTVNLGDEQAVSINEIVLKIMKIFDLSFSVKHDLTKPVGRKIKSVSSQLFKRILPDFEPQIQLNEGLKEMKKWYDRKKSLGIF